MSFGGIRTRFVDGVNGLRVHLLEAGRPEHPCVLLLLHVFPETIRGARWCRLWLRLGSCYRAGSAIGCGCTTGWDPAYDSDLASFRPMNLVADTIRLLTALGRSSVEAVVGHDFGVSVAAWCALIRPDVFRSVVLMSASFGGPAGMHAFLRAPTAVALMFRLCSSPEFGTGIYQTDPRCD
jgi:pimeloyl-ACP methyl ester carboxylesterase